jgi:DNA-binding NtrC family response regulator
MSPRILLYGLPAELSRELRDVLITTHHVPDIEDEEEIRTGSVSWPEIDLVFCPAERNSLANLLQATAQQRPRLRIIATSRLPETAEWLDSVEAGAADYCAAPFEATQIRWLLDTHLSKQKPVAA